MPGRDVNCLRKPRRSITRVILGDSSGQNNSATSDGVLKLCRHRIIQLSRMQFPQQAHKLVTVSYLQGLVHAVETRGPLPAYLGSRTTHSIILFHPWEKESIGSVIDRVARLRPAINLFVGPEDGVAKSILNKLSALTGENWKEEVTNFSQTDRLCIVFIVRGKATADFFSIRPTPLTHCPCHECIFVAESKLIFNF